MSFWIKSIRYIATAMVIPLVSILFLPELANAYAVDKAREEAKKIRIELPELRTENSKTYVKSDGKTYVTEQYLAPVHFKENGHWFDIDNNVQTAAKEKALDQELPYINKGNKYRVGFAKQSLAKKLVRFQLGQAKADFHLIDAKNVQAKIQKNQVTYSGVYPSTDLVYYVDHNGVKEEWVLHQFEGKSIFTMGLDVKNAEWKEQKDGSIQFVNNKGKELFSIPRPMMMDANERVSYDVKLSIREEGGKTYLDLQADEDWLKAKERKYPVTIDPSLTIQGTNETKDAFVSEKNSSANYGGEIFLISGTHVDYGKTRSFIKFSLQPLLSGANITSAKLYLNQYATAGNQQVNLYPVTSSWDSTTIKWSQQPTIGSLLTSTTVGEPGEYSWDITSLVRGWYSGSTKNYGVSLRHATETNDRKSFRSSDYGADPTKKPKLVIEYTISPLGQEEFWTSAASNVNTFNGNFFLPETDVEILGRGIPAKIDRYYNSLSNTSGIFGYGWTSTMEQHLIDSGDGPIQYVDPDGTVHSFTPKGDGIYETTEVLQLELSKKADGTYVLTTADQTQYHFNTVGKLTKIVDSNNNTTTITYTGDVPTQITDASGRKITLTYDANNRVSKVTDPANRTIEYSYTNGDLTSVTKKDANGSTLSTVSYEYDAAHNLTEITDANGHKKTVVYTNDQVTEISFPLTVDGQVQTAKTTFAYDPANRVTTVTQPKGNKVLYTHNDYGNVIQITQDPTGYNYKQTFTYNDQNQLTSQKNANANAAQSNATYNYTYDDKGNLVSVTNPLQETTTTVYDENNNPIKETDAEGNTTTYEYDENNNQTSTTDATEKSSAQKVDAYGNVIESTSEMSPGNNLAINGSFEIDRNGDSWPDDWTKIGPNQSVISWDNTGLTTEGITLGQKSIKITNPSAATAVGSARVPYNPNKTYALSGYVKTQNAQGIGRLYVLGFDAAGAVTKSITYFGITGTQDATRLHMMLEPNAFPTNTATIQLRGYVGGGKDNLYGGTYWFDGLQIEEEFYGAYNVLENGDLERDIEPAGDYIPDRWFAAGNMTISPTMDGLDSTEAHSGQYSMRIVGEAGKWKTLRQDVKLAGGAGSVLTVSGFSKVENPNPNGGIYGYIIETYMGSTKQETFTFNFDKKKSHDWQHRTAQIKTTKAFDNIKVFYEYSDQAGKAWFDTAKVMIGSITTKHQYDANGNYEEKRTDPVGRVVENQYDTIGNQTSEKVGNHTTTFEYDGLDRLKKVIDSKTGVTQYQYDGNGNKTKVINAKNKETTYAYNEIGQVTKETDANNQSITYDYDLNGNQTKITYPNGNVVEFEYNTVDRQTSVKYNGTERYVFDYDPNGNLTKEIDRNTNHTTSYEYDADNKSKSVQYHDSRTDYQYDKNGNVTQQKHTVGTSIITHDYAYNSVNQLTQIKANGTNVATFTYNEKDLIASRKNQDGTTSLFEYNGAGDLIKQTIYDKNGQPIDSFSYTYDNKENIASITSNAGTTTYEYDALNQLVKETWPDGTVIEYSYDAVGNRTSKKVTKNGTTTTTTYTYDDADQLTAINGTNYSYDEAGNLISDGNRTYVYDAENRLIQVKDSSGNTIVSFTYRSDGMRTSMTTSAGKTYFHYDENKNVSFETNASSQVIASYTFDKENRPVSMTKDGQTYYFQLNGQGDVIALTDANGNVVATYSYDAYGRVISQTGTVKSPYLYRGYRYDWETDLYYLQSRYYNPDTGRFLTRDTFEGFEDIPLSLNKYSYVENNPVSLVDPNGKAGIKVKYVAMVIDLAVVAWGGWSWYASRKALNTFLRKNFGRITRLVRGRFVRKQYSAASKFLGSLLNTALAISGNSIGQVIAKAMDRYLDPRLGYRKNNGRVFG